MWKGSEIWQILKHSAVLYFQKDGTQIYPTPYAATTYISTCSIESWDLCCFSLKPEKTEAMEKNDVIEFLKLKS